MSETRTVQERAREHAAYIGCDPRSTQLLSKAADRIDALEKALEDLRSLISSSASKNGLVVFMGNADQVRAIDALLARAALHPSENDAQVAGPMKLDSMNLTADEVIKARKEVVERDFVLASSEARDGGVKRLFYNPATKVYRVKTDRTEATFGQPDMAALHYSEK